MVVNDSTQVEVTRLPVTTLRGWRKFVERKEPSFTLVSDDEFRRMDEDERESYNEDRMDYHSAMVVARTSTVREVVTTTKMLLQLNKHESGARRGLVVSGQAATGKTTSLIEGVSDGLCKPYREER